MLLSTLRGWPSVKAKPIRSLLFESYFTYGRWPGLEMNVVALVHAPVPTRERTTGLKFGPRENTYVLFSLLSRYGLAYVQPLVPDGAPVFGSVVTTPGEIEPSVLIVTSCIRTDAPPCGA